MKNKTPHTVQPTISAIFTNASGQLISFSSPPALSIVLAAYERFLHALTGAAPDAGYSRNLCMFDIAECRERT
jgi:hypothetical protein